MAFIITLTIAFGIILVASAILDFIDFQDKMYPEAAGQVAIFFVKLMLGSFLFYFAMTSIVEGVVSRIPLS